MSLTLVLESVKGGSSRRDRKPEETQTLVKRSVSSVLNSSIADSQKVNREFTTRVAGFMVGKHAVGGLPSNELINVGAAAQTPKVEAVFVVSACVHTLKPGGHQHHRVTSAKNGHTNRFTSLLSYNPFVAEDGGA